MQVSHERSMELLAEDDMLDENEQVRKDRELPVGGRVYSMLMDMYRFACDRFGAENVVGACIHLDEYTPHMHVFVVPITMKAKGKCGIVFIDYLGLLRFEGTQPLYQQISQATKIFKRLAKDCRCPVVLLCQLNRNNVKEKRPPQLQDLRGSGSIEQDADIVLMIERKEGRDLDLWLRKNRHGYGGEVRLELTHDNLYSNFKSRNE